MAPREAERIADRLDTGLLIMIKFKNYLILFICILSRPAWPAPDEEGLGKSQGYPAGTRLTLEQEPHLVASYSGGREPFFPHHVVKKGVARPLTRSEEPRGFRTRLTAGVTPATTTSIVSA